MITLPQGRYVPADVASGLRASGPTSTIQFRVPVPVGAQVKLVLRIGAIGNDPRIRIRAEEGGETEIAIPGGAERLVVLPCAVTKGQLVKVNLSSAGPTTAASKTVGEPDWVLKGILYFDSVKSASDAGGKFELGDRLLLQSSARDENSRAASIEAFFETPDSHWPISFRAFRDAPIFADRADRDLFYSGCRKDSNIPQVGRVDENIRLVRRSNQFVSLSRSSEGSAFDRSGVWRAFGYLHGSPVNRAHWLSKDSDSLSIDEAALAWAPYYDGSYVIFFNGLLENYYHWLAEGILSLEILLAELGPNSNYKILLPRSISTQAGFDHRRMLRAAGLEGCPIVEVEEDLIRVREAIWVDSDLVASMPAHYLKRFQQRMAASHGTGCRTRRLLVARRGGGRRIHNMEEVEDFLSKYGFETVYLEGRSFEEQISMFNSAEFIVAIHGAALTNLLFCEPGTRVIELMPSSELRLFFWFIAQKLDLVHGLQFCKTVPEGTFDAELIVDVGKLKALMLMVEAHL